VDLIRKRRLSSNKTRYECMHFPDSADYAGVTVGRNNNAEIYGHWADNWIPLHH